MPAKTSTPKSAEKQLKEAYGPPIRLSLGRISTKSQLYALKIAADVEEAKQKLEDRKNGIMDPERAKMIRDWKAKEKKAQEARRLREQAGDPMTENEREVDPDEELTPPPSPRLADSPTFGSSRKSKPRSRSRSRSKSRSRDRDIEGGRGGNWGSTGSRRKSHFPTIITSATRLADALGNVREPEPEPEDDSPPPPSLFSPLRPIPKIPPLFSYPNNNDPATDTSSTSTHTSDWNLIEDENRERTHVTVAAVMRRMGSTKWADDLEEFDRRVALGTMRPDAGDELRELVMSAAGVRSSGVGEGARSLASSLSSSLASSLGNGYDSEDAEDGGCDGHGEAADDPHHNAQSDATRGTDNTASQTHTLNATFESVIRGLSLPPPELLNPGACGLAEADVRAIWCAMAVGVERLVKAGGRSELDEPDEGDECDEGDEPDEGDERDDGHDEEADENEPGDAEERNEHDEHEHDRHEEDAEQPWRNDKLVYKSKSLSRQRATLLRELAVAKRASLHRSSDHFSNKMTNPPPLNERQQTPPGYRQAQAQEPWQGRSPKQSGPTGLRFRLNPKASDRNNSKTSSSSATTSSYSEENDDDTKNFKKPTTGTMPTKPHGAGVEQEKEQEREEGEIFSDDDQDQSVDEEMEFDAEIDEDVDSDEAGEREGEADGADWEDGTGDVVMADD